MVRPGASPYPREFLRLSHAKILVPSISIVQRLGRASAFNLKAVKKASGRGGAEGTFSAPRWAIQQKGADFGIAGISNHGLCNQKLHKVVICNPLNDDNDPVCDAQ
jgi:hypothetical protein